MTELESLRSEVALLRAEAEAHRAHVCLPSAPRCTCCGTAAPGVNGCPVHPAYTYQWNGYVAPLNVCGAAGYNPVLTFPVTVKAGEWPYPTNAAAGCAGGALQTFIVNA